MNVLLLHGWAANHHVFDEVCERLPEYHCIAPDLPGHGQSPLDRDFDLSAIAAQYAGNLDAPTHILGWSLGGVIAMMMAAQYPHLVRSLTVISSFACYRQQADYPIGFAQPFLTQAATAFSRDFAKQMAGFLQLEWSDRQQKERLDYWLHQLTQYGTPSALQAASEAVIACDIRPLLPSIHCPTLLIFGKRDRMTPPTMGEYLHQHIAQSELHILPRATHMPFLRHLEGCLNLIQTLWRSC